MSYEPKPEEDGLRRYGYRWGRQTEDTSRCIVSVHSRERGGASRQCDNKRGHGPDGLYCKTHDPKAALKRSEASSKRWHDKVYVEGRPGRQRDAYRKALEAIAEGHNDPRAMAIEALKTD